MRLRANRFLTSCAAFAGLALASSLAFADTAIGVTSDGRLVAFDTSAPSRIPRRVAVTGLQAGETIVGVDYRPQDGRLYAVGSTSRLYVIDPATGAAAQVGAAAFTPTLSGTGFGVDFDPVSDRLRVVSDARQNLRLDPTTGAGTADTNLAYAVGDVNFVATPNVVGLAYDRNNAGVAQTTAFGIDSNLDVLVRLGDVNGTPNSANTGALHTIGALGVNTSGLVGFDVDDGVAFAAMTAPAATSSNLYTVNLASGAATLVGPIGGTTVVGLTIVPQRFVVVNATGQLVTFAPGSPGVVSTPVAVTGLAGGETIVAFSVRPANGRLYAVGSAGHLYRVNATTGAATQVGGTFAVALSGTQFGMDFDPTTGLIRLVSDADQNLRVNPDTGAVVDGDTATAGVQGDANLAFAAGDANAAQNPNVVAIAYDSNDPTATTTTLYGIDTNLDTLVRVGSVGGAPNSASTGKLSSVGPLGVNATGKVGFEIVNGTGYALIATSGQATPSLYTINLATGAATLVGNAAIGGLPVAMGVLSTVPRALPAGTDLFGLTTGNSLVSFRSDAPGTVSAPISITGLAAGENVVSIDVRPSSGVLYGVTDQNRLYAINHTNGAATLIGTTMTPAVAGANVGMDFDPKADVLRVVDDSGRNKRVDPATGAVIDGDTGTLGVQGDADLAYVAGDPNFGQRPSVVEIAYDRNVPSAPATTLFGIDNAKDVLVRVGSPDGTPDSASTGKLTTIGPLGVDATGPAGFEIAPNGGVFAAIEPSGATSSDLFTIDTDTGTATLIGQIGSTTPLRGLSIAPTSDLAPTNGSLRVTALSIVISFCGSPKDSITMSGTVPALTGPLAGQTVTVNVGGFAETFTLDAKGKGVSGSSRFALTGKPKNGVQKFVVQFRKVDVSDQLADEGLTGDQRLVHVERQIHVAVTVNGTTFGEDVTVLYSSQIQHDGIATLKK